jgi:hypothetical protein
MLETTSLSPHLGVGGHNQNISLNSIDYLDGSAGLSNKNNLHSDHPLLNRIIT